MNLWITEFQTPHLGFSLKVKSSLRIEQTDFQHLAVVDTEQFGRMLFLDDMVMTSEKDEFFYHEMITNVALNSHPLPEKVLIIGGGDGGALREVVKHPQVKSAVLVEIDNRVMQASKDFFPELSISFSNPKATVITGDGIKYVQTHKDEFDLILIDSTEPLGPSVELFSQIFYQNAAAALKDDGILVAQSGSPLFNDDLIKLAYQGIKSAFPITKLYLAPVPTYPSGTWSFTIGSKQHDPENIVHQPVSRLKYYTPAIHKAAFQLPIFVQQILKEEK